MIRLKDENGHWIHEIWFEDEDENEIETIDISKYAEFAKLFEKDDPLVEKLIDDYGFKVVEFE